MSMSKYLREEDMLEDLLKQEREKNKSLRAQVEAIISLPAVYAHQINTGVREVYDPLQRFYRMEDILHALNPKGTADDRA